MSAKRQSSSESLKLHRSLRGKIEIKSKVPILTKENLEQLYTPGVGEVASFLASNPERLRELTIKGNCVAIVSDGSAVLGLGNIGAEGAIPVMEGKAILFKELANIDAFPIVLATQDVDQIVSTVKYIAPIFGGINLEDISAPRCFDIEERLKRELSIPVMHDDQHGTAVVAIAALINALKVVKKEFHRARVVVVGAGAAGTAICKLLLREKVGDVVLVDSKGIVNRKRTDLTDNKRRLALTSNKKNLTGGIKEALAGADAVIGVSGPNAIPAEAIKTMNPDAIVFSLANPIPEIMPEDAQRSGARVIATGRSDFPNQVNNALVFPGMFRGALDHGLSEITEAMKSKAAHALARMIKSPTADRIIPDVLDKSVVKVISAAIG